MLEETRALEHETDQIVPWLLHKKGTRVGSFRKAWSTACKKAGLAGRIPHRFRRTAVRNLERGVARAVIAGERVDGIRVPPPIAIAHHLIRTWALGEQ